MINSQSDFLELKKWENLTLEADQKKANGQIAWLRDEDMKKIINWDRFNG